MWTLNFYMKSPDFQTKISGPQLVVQLVVPKISGADKLVVPEISGPDWFVVLK